MSWKNIPDQVEHPISRYAQQGDAILIRTNKNNSEKDERVKRFVGSSENVEECLNALHEVAERHSIAQKEQALDDASQKCHRTLNLEGQYNVNDSRVEFANISESDE